MLQRERAVVVWILHLCCHIPFSERKGLANEKCLSVCLSNQSQSSIPNLVKSVHDDAEEILSYVFEPHEFESELGLSRN